MSTSWLQHTQKIYNFHSIKECFQNNLMTWTICRNPNAFQCTTCKSKNVRLKTNGFRFIKTLRMGLQFCTLKVYMHRIICKDCGVSLTEVLDFLPSRKCHYTHVLADFILEELANRTIKSLADFFGLPWNTIKNIEKKHLKEQFSTINFDGVTTIGIDEVYMGYKIKYLTIIRDLISRRVLSVGEGRNSESLEGFLKQIIDIKDNIKVVAMDMGNTYASWVKKHLPNATITFDRFHVIKSMNEKVDQVRRKTMADLCEEDRKFLKGQRYLLLHNIENLSAKKLEYLNTLRSTYFELGDVSMMKECLRNIYSIAESIKEARFAFEHWCKLAIESKIGVLKTMAKTITQRLEGIVSFWETKVTSASMEGFNNKIGAMQRKAYGYRDLEYLKLKIYDLGSR